MFIQRNDNSDNWKKSLGVLNNSSVLKRWLEGELNVNRLNNECSISLLVQCMVIKWDINRKMNNIQF